MVPSIFESAVSRVVAPAAILPAATGSFGKTLPSPKADHMLRRRLPHPA